MLQSIHYLSFLFVCNCTCYCQSHISVALLNCTMWADVVLARSPLYCSSISLCPWRSNKQSGGKAPSESEIGVRTDNSSSYNETHNNNPFNRGCRSVEIEKELESCTRPWGRQQTTTWADALRGKKSGNDWSNSQLLNWMAHSCGQSWTVNIINIVIVHPEQCTLRQLFEDTETEETMKIQQKLISQKC